jgi:hypothetical protein
VNAVRWVANQRRWMCSLLFLLRIHRPDCEDCHLRETCGDETRKRLEELNWRTQPYWLNNVGHGEVEGRRFQTERSYKLAYFRWRAGEEERLEPGQF